MLRPRVLTRIEQGDNVARLIVDGCQLIALAAVTVKASKSQVLESILPAFRYRRQMIDSETNALPPLIGMTILAQGVGTFANLLSKDGR